MYRYSYTYGLNSIKYIYVYTHTYKYGLKSIHYTYTHKYIYDWNIPCISVCVYVHSLFIVKSIHYTCTHRVNNVAFEIRFASSYILAVWQLLWKSLFLSAHGNRIPTLYFRSLNKTVQNMICWAQRPYINDIIIGVAMNMIMIMITTV